MNTEKDCCSDGKIRHELDHFQVLENEAGEVMIAIQPVGAGVEAGFIPKFCYDGGQQAVLCKNQTDVIVLNGIHEAVREQLALVQTVLVAEILDGNVQAEYLAEK